MQDDSIASGLAHEGKLMQRSKKWRVYRLIGAAAAAMLFIFVLRHPLPPPPRTNTANLIGVGVVLLLASQLWVAPWVADRCPFLSRKFREETLPGFVLLGVVVGIWSVALYFRGTLDY